MYSMPFTPFRGIRVAANSACANAKIIISHSVKNVNKNVKVCSALQHDRLNHRYKVKIQRHHPGN